MASNQQCKQFIAEIAPIIQKVAKERGYLICSTVIAQACIESAYGTSSLGYKYHNYFGMKCGQSWKGKSVNLSTKEEYTIGHLTTIKDNFRVYDTMEDGVKGYYDFISTKRYSNLKTADTSQLYAERLKADGYATSSSYVNTLMNTCKKWNLAEWDNFNGKPSVSDKTDTNVIPDYRLGQTYKTNANLFIRVEPEGDKMPLDLITKNGKQNSYDDGNGYAILRKGTKVSCKGVNTIGKDVWIKIPSGYIAAYYKGKIYVE